MHRKANQTELLIGLLQSAAKLSDELEYEGINEKIVEAMLLATKAIATREASLGGGVKASLH